MASAESFRLTLPGGCHLAMLTAVAAYCLTYYPASLPAVVLLFGAAVLSETAPARWQRWLFGEAVLVTTAAATWALFVELPQASFQGWLRMVLAYWLLVPSRPGLLRWMLSLVIAELLILGAGHSGFRDLLIGRVPLAGRLAVASPLLFLVPIGIGSLVLDAWLAGSAGARTRGSVPRALRGLFRWGVLPGLLLAAAVLLVGPGFARHEKRVPPKSPGGITGVNRPQLTPGEQQWIVCDETPRARLLWEQPGQPLIQGTAYLRLFTMPRLVLGGTHREYVTWEAQTIDRLLDTDSRFRADQPFAWAVRLPMGSDAVLRIDGARGVELRDLAGDIHGNLYLANIDLSPRAYRVNLATDEDEPEEMDARTLADCLALPRELDALPWEHIEEPTWRRFRADTGGDAIAAAEAITAALQGRCRYDLKNLPKGEPRVASVLETFLFGPPAQRRGHCQYFATAAAILLRRLGHPTRCITGYASNERDEDGFLFRGWHAHAWLEVRDRAGRWHRIDATPPAHLDTRIEIGEPPKVDAELERLTVPKPEEVRATPPPPPETPERWPLAAVGVAVLGALVLWWRRRRRTGRVDPVQAELTRQSEQLVRVAIELGVPVTPHTTLSQIAAALTDRTGVDLGAALDAHLAARFGGGPLPPPWPLDALRSSGPAPRRQPAKS